MNDTLNAVKNLREITGAGFLDCKKALLENNNNIESSIDYLRKNGLLKATKKSSREAKDGAIGIYSNKMNCFNFALAHSELGLSHFTTDLILVLSFAIVTALPMSLLRPQIQEDNVKSSLFKSSN